jgi:hypothetical protein
MVGTWVASGLRVQHIDGFVALAKLIRKAASAEKDAEGVKPDVDLVGEQKPQPQLTAEADKEQLEMA